jgi:ankyrin repeat protein
MISFEKFVLIALSATSLSMLTAADLHAGQIHEAAATGDMDKVRALLEANPNLLESKGETGSTPLIRACWYPPSFPTKVDVANYLIDKGANVNAKNNFGATALYFSVGDFDLTKRLINKGAEVNLHVFTPDGLTPLHYATWIGNLKVIKFLIEHGADVNAVCTDGTVLQNAIKRKSESTKEIMKLLLENGAKFKEFSYGNTELHMAALYGFPDIAHLLIEHGADVNAVNEYGHTPLYYATRHGYRKTADALIAAGADESTIVETNYGKASQLNETLKEDEAYLWFLGGFSPGTGYAVKTKNHLLIFDPFKIDSSPEAGLANGKLNPEELAGQKITVLLTRSLHPQLNPTVGELMKRFPDADFVLSFKPTEDNEGNDDMLPYRLAKANESFSMGGIQVHTIQAAGKHFIEKDNGLGYLVEADMVKFFHAGLHASSNDPKQLKKYRKEIDCLKPYGPIDFAILPIGGRHINIAYKHYLYLIDLLSPKAIYLIGYDLVYDEHLKCLKALEKRNVPVEYPNGGVALGQRFHYVRD